jgi:hypothetical protein
MASWSEEISEGREDCGGRVEWTKRYRIEADDSTCTVKVVVKFHCDPQSGVSLTELGNRQQRWKNAIEAKWSRRFRLHLSRGECRCTNYDVVIEVQFLGSTDVHHTVKVFPGTGRSNLGTWYMGRPDDSATHEFGHAIGAKDEYSDPNCPARQVTDAASVMNDITGNPQARHFADFAIWLSGKTGCYYQVA